MYECPFPDCDETFSSEEELDKHLREKHRVSLKWFRNYKGAFSDSQKKNE